MGKGFMPQGIKKKCIYTQEFIVIQWNSPCTGENPLQERRNIKSTGVHFSQLFSNTLQLSTPTLHHHLSNILTLCG